jgi:hypothetical protein
MFRAQQEIDFRQIFIALGAGLALGIVTRWPAAFVIGTAGAFVVGPVLRSSRGISVATKIEAISTWTEMLRDSLSASAGLGQAIVTSAPLSPLIIRPQVMKLASRIEAGLPIGDSLRVFSKEIDESSADLVITALILASEQRAQKLGELLGALADSVREEVAARLRIESARAPIRTSVRVITGFSAAFAVFLMIVARQYLAPYSSASGQVVMVVVGALYLIGLFLIGLMSVAKPLPRISLARSEMVQA